MDPRDAPWYQSPEEMDYPDPPSPCPYESESDADEELGQLDVPWEWVRMHDGIMRPMCVAPPKTAPAPELVDTQAATQQQLATQESTLDDFQEQSQILDEEAERINVAPSQILDFTARPRPEYFLPDPAPEKPLGDFVPASDYSPNSDEEWIASAEIDEEEEKEELERDCLEVELRESYALRYPEDYMFIDYEYWKSTCILYGLRSLRYHSFFD
jgi:hypothetical protein